MTTGVGISGELPAKAAIEQALQQAMVALRSGRPGEAEWLAADVLNARPQHPPALHLLGFALLMQGRAQEAVAPLEQAARSLRDPAIETQLAMALRQIGRHDDALARLNRAIKRKPPFPAAQYELGSRLFSLQRFDEAIETLERGVAAAPAIPELWTLLGSSRHALCLLRGHDPAEAKAAFARALDIAPGHAGALYGMGLIMMDQREFAQAAEHLRQVVAGNPTDPQGRLNLGICLLELGQTDAAFEALRAATGSGPQFFGQVLKALTSSGHGRFWLRPSAAAKFLKTEKS
jgi:tetratricopeptide (TPR) repeat protein